MNKSMIVCGGGMEKKARVGEKDREGLRLSFQKIDDCLTIGRADIDFIETRNFVFFDKNIFRRMVEGPYEVMHWELKKAIAYISCQEEKIANQHLNIIQMDNALEFAWGAARKTYAVAQEFECKLKRAQSQLKQAEIMIEDLEDRLRDAEDDTSNDEFDPECSPKANDSEDIQGELLDMSFSLCRVEDELKKVQEAYEEEKVIRILENGELKRVKAKLKDAEEESSNSKLLYMSVIMELRDENGQLKRDALELDGAKSELKSLQEAYEEEKKSRALEKAAYENEIALLKAELAAVNERK